VEVKKSEKRINLEFKVTLIYKGILRMKKRNKRLKQGSRRREDGSRESHRRKGGEGGGKRLRCSRDPCSSSCFFLFRFPEFCSIVRQGERAFSMNSRKYPIVFFHTKFNVKFTKQYIH